MAALATAAIPAEEKVTRPAGAPLWRDLLVRFDVRGEIQWMNPAASECFGRCLSVAALAIAAQPSEGAVSWQRLPLGLDWLWLSALGREETRGRALRADQLRRALLEACRLRGRWNLSLLSAQGALEWRARQTWQEHLSRRLSAELLSAVEAERGRIARELHDDSGQSLAGIILNLEVAERQLDVSRTEALARLGRCRELASLTLAQVRRLSHDLHPPEWSSESFATAAGWLIENMGVREKLEVQTSLDLPEQLDPAAETVLYRALQEGLTNALKHARARHLRIEARQEGEAAILEIVDDGAGFQPEDPGQRRGIGLRNIRRRAESLGGSLEIRSEPGRGCRLRVSVPLTNPS